MDLAAINYDGFFCIGGGNKAAVITNNIIAIKIGELFEEDVETLDILHQHGFAPKILAFSKDVKIPDEIIWLLRIVYSYGIKMTGESYIKEIDNEFIADVMIMEYAEPICNHYDRPKSVDEARVLIDLAGNLETEVFNKLGIGLSDKHRYNVGVYQNRYVFFDV